MSSRNADIQRIERYDSTTSEYTLAINTDEDHASQVELDNGQIAWKSTLRHDRLYRYVDSNTGRVRYRLEDIPPEQGGEYQLISLIAEGGRGAEFSELVMFGKRLVTFDDRIGPSVNGRAPSRRDAKRYLVQSSSAKFTSSATV